MDPLIPDYAGACLCNVAPTIVEPPPERPSWFPPAAWGARQVVLLTLDGLGWEQLRARAALAPALHGFDGGDILTVAPSTTATALSSLAVGCPPGEHGVVGYRINVEGDVLNVLRWQTTAGDARQPIPPTDIQGRAPFGGRRPIVVTRAEFAGTGFTDAHLGGVRLAGWRTTSTLLVEVRRALQAGEAFVYAYYDGIDKVAHEYGLGEHYDAELVEADRLVADLAASLPAGAALLVTADHGQVDVGEAVVPLHPEVLADCAFLSGEGRFRWLHAAEGRAGALVDAARRHHGEVAWVRSVDEVAAEEWLGPKLSDAARARLGDVAVAAFEPIAFEDPADSGPYRLRARHGSLTPAEMRVPLLAWRA